MLLSEYLRSRNFEIVDIHMKNDMHIGDTCLVLLTGSVVYKNEESLMATSIFPENEGIMEELYELADTHPLDLEIIVYDSDDISKARWVNVVFKDKTIGYSGNKILYD